jgi:hypothetical protein
MKSPADFLQRISISYELGQLSVRSQSLRVLAMSVNRVSKNSLISASTEDRSTSWSLSTSVMGRSDFQPEPGADPRFWTARDEELDRGI